MIIGETLFRDDDLDSYLRGQAAAIDNHVRQHVSTGDLGKSDAEIVKAMMLQARVEPLQVDFDNPQKQVSEAQVEVNDMFSGRVTIDGVRATRSYGFTGDPKHFTRRTSPWTSSYPHGEIRGGRITIGIEGRNDLDALRQEIEREEKTLREYVDRSRAQVEAHNAALEGLLAQAVAKRRAQLKSIDDLAGKI